MGAQLQASAVALVLVVEQAVHSKNVHTPGAHARLSLSLRLYRSRFPQTLLPNHISLQTSNDYNPVSKLPIMLAMNLERSTNEASNLAAQRTLKTSSRATAEDEHSVPSGTSCATSSTRKRPFTLQMLIFTHICLLISCLFSCNYCSITTVTPIMIDMCTGVSIVCTILSLVCTRFCSISSAELCNCIIRSESGNTDSGFVKFDDLGLENYLEVASKHRYIGQSVYIDSHISFSADSASS
eukprot:gene14353-20350_t